MISGLFENTVGAKIARGEMTMEEYEEKLGREEYERGRRDMIEDVCEFCKTPEFFAAWVNAKGQRFADFLAEMLAEKFGGSHEA